MISIFAPSRVGQLIERLEAGHDPTAAELARLAVLQALDVAKLGEDYLREALERREQRLNEFRDT